MKQLFSLIFFLSTISLSYSQGQSKVFGHVTDEEGEPLPNTTIFIKELGTGSVSNDAGYYEIQLTPGVYHLVFQYLGYESKELEVDLKNNNIERNVFLKSEIVMLRNIVISGKDEDPAYAIMRKAIAKAKYHTQQIDSFSARVYMKGKGRLIDSPFFVRKQLKKEGIDSTKLFVSETISEIKYKRPATYSERIISVRSSGPENESDPMEFVSGSFYEPKIGDLVSPLSPKAFAYYRFEYLGTTRDKDYEISKIRVIPRVSGENVVEGVIYIVEDYFSIHSLDFRTVQLGINIDIEQIYQPIETNVWLPVSHKFYIKGKFWGFMFEFNYLASVSNYQVTLNPDLPHEVLVVDEKSEEEFAEDLDQLADKENTKSIQEKLTEGEEVTTKELRTILRSYEKSERQKLDEPLVVFNKELKIDSLAYDYDSAYWSENRPIPLNENEIKGYQWLDSLAEVNKKEADGDTTTTRDKKSFLPWHIITGGRYDVGEKAHLNLNRIRFEYNTVEGFNLESQLDFTKTFEKLRYFKTYGLARYGFSGKDVYYRLGMQYDYGPRFMRSSLRINGGKYVYQFNGDNPIHPTVNSFTSLFLEQNFMKIYEKEFVSFRYEKDLTKKLKLRTGIEWSHRSSLENNSDFKVINVKDREYTENAPENAELPDTKFNPHEALIFTANLQFRPGLRFGKRNEHYYELKSRAPVFLFDYRQGLRQVEGNADFHHLNLNIKDEVEFGRNILKTAIDVGAFIGNTPEYFMDFKHFMGNQSPFLPAKGLTSYRLLNYYRHSTADKHFSGFMEYHPSRLLFSQIKGLRRKGFKEYVFANYLATKTSENYFEVGIGFDNVFKFLKMETITSFQDGSFWEFGVRVGVASFLNFDGNGGVSVQF